MSTGAAIDYDDGDMPTEDRPAVYACDWCGDEDSRNAVYECSTCGRQLCFECIGQVDGEEVFCEECY